MTQEEKDLLLKDLCARLPFNYLVEYNGEKYDVLGIAHGRLVLCKPFMSHTLNENPLVEEVKPYLLPMSSMTEEQYNELHDKLNELELQALNDEISIIEAVKFEIDYYLENHYDYRGLIEKDLAIDATGLNIY